MSNVSRANCLNNEFDSGDIAVMMFTTTFVMLQTPFMGIAQAGLIKRKNALSMLMQTITGMSIGSILYFIFGFSVTYGPSVGGVIGNLQYAFLKGIPFNDCYPGAPTIPVTLFAAFQMMFALMTPIIVTGAWAEKMTFEAFLVFISVWPVLVYYPLVHWIWNAEGFLANWGVIDFAGGMTIHVSSGIAALICAIVIVRRKTNEESQPHNIPLTVLGSSVIWAGWYSFNGGSAFGANEVSSVALPNTHLSACFAGMMWVILSKVKTGKWVLTDLMSGSLAGLACITPGSGFVLPEAACIFGILGGAASWGTVQFFSAYLDIDDVLDVMSLQGTPGFVGSILVGLFAHPELVPGDYYGAFYGGGFSLLGVQFVACLITIFWAGLWTTALLFFMKYTIGIDITLEVEEIGLDAAQLGEAAYDENLNELAGLSDNAITEKLLDAAGRGHFEELSAILNYGISAEACDYDGRTALHLAAANGRLRIVKYLVQVQFVDINIKDKDGATPLEDAFLNRQQETVGWLRKNKAKMDYSELSYKLFYACSYGNYEEVVWILKSGIKINITDYDLRTPLMVAVSENQPEIVQLLLAKKAKVDLRDRWGKTARQYAFEQKLTDMLDMLAAAHDVSSDEMMDVELEERDEKFTSQVRDFLHAASDSNLEEMSRLLKKGMNPNCYDYDGRTALHLAAAKGDKNVIKYLLKKKEINVNCMDNRKRTPLQEALNNNHFKAANLLKSAGGIIVNKKVGYELCTAAASGDTAALEKIISQGADINLGDYDGRTALHLAASTNQKEAVQWILKKGANVNAKDRFGYTALDDAKREKNKTIMKMLQKVQNIDE